MCVCVVCVYVTYPEIIFTLLQLKTFLSYFHPVINETQWKIYKEEQFISILFVKKEQKSNAEKRKKETVAVPTRSMTSGLHRDTFLSVSTKASSSSLPTLQDKWLLLETSWGDTTK